MKNLVRVRPDRPQVGGRGGSVQAGVMSDGVGAMQADEPSTSDREYEVI